MMIPLKTQIAGAAFLAARRTALLADAPRVGKTGAAIMAAEEIEAHRILIVTTASGRAVWRRAIRDWSRKYVRAIFILGVDRGAPDPRMSGVTIVSWDSIRQAKVFAYLMDREFDLAILDEDHRAKNPDTKTAQAIYGKFNSRGERRAAGIVTSIPRVWHLTGTPLPHDPGDTWCRLRASNPEALNGGEFPNVMAYDDFRSRYCVIVQKKLKWNSIPVVVGGRNEDELKRRIGDWMLRRTQADVGIRPSVTELMPLILPAGLQAQIKTDRRISEIVEAIDAGRTGELDMHLGPLRRLTGRLKAEAVIEAVKDILEGNNDKLVLAYYHREVGDILAERLLAWKIGVERVDGSTPAHDREYFVETFTIDSKCRVFLAQIDACGEAIDLSAAAELWFVESTFSPKSMAQMASRISNVAQTKPTFVKVLTIENSIDEAIQAALLRLWSSINQVLK